MKRSFFVIISLLLLSGFSSPVSADIPLIKIISPVADQTVLGRDVTLSFVAHLIIPAEGYLLFWLDNPLQTASTAGRLMTHHDYLLKNLSPAAHSLTLEAVRPDGKSFDPPVKDTVRFKTVLSSAITPSPLPRKSASGLFSFINVQSLSIIAAVLLILIGLIVWSKWSRPDFY